MNLWQMLQEYEPSYSASLMLSLWCWACGFGSCGLLVYGFGWVRSREERQAWLRRKR